MRHIMRNICNNILIVTASKMKNITKLKTPGSWPGHHHRGVLMAVAHGVWKCPEPLFDQVQWLGIAKNDPLGSSEQGIGVSGTQQRPLHAVPHGLPSETSRRGTRGGTRGGTSADIKKSISTSK